MPLKTNNLGIVEINGHRIGLYTHSNELAQGANHLGLFIYCPKYGGELCEPNVLATECYLCEESIIPSNKVSKVPDPFENMKDGVTGEVMPLSDHIIKVING